MSQRETEQSPPDEYYLDLARRAPKVDIQDSRVQDYLAAKARGENVKAPAHYQFKNNLYLLFSSRRDTRPDSMIVEVYLKRAESLGQPWENFITNNTQLLGDIDIALEGLIKQVCFCKSSG